MKKVGSTISSPLVMVHNVTGDDEEAEYSFIENGADSEPLLRSSSEDLGREPEITIIMDEPPEETSLSICLQVTLPYIIAGMGMVMAGMVLDVVQVGLKWILH